MMDQGNLIVLTPKKWQIPDKVKDQVRKRQKRMSNIADSAGEEHSIIWRMFMAVTMNAATFMGKNFLDNQNSIMNSKDLTLKKMFDITVKLGVRTRRDQQCRQDSLGKTFMETSVVDW